MNFIKRILIKLGLHGIRHKAAIQKVLDFMKSNGIGPS